MTRQKLLLALYATIAIFLILLLGQGVLPSLLGEPPRAPLTLLAYYDDTNSGKTLTAEQDRESELVRRAIEWFDSAPAGSTFEIYATSVIPGEPERRLAYAKRRLHRSEIVAERRRLTELIQSALTNIPPAPNSSIIEDCYALISRGAHQNTPYELLAISDLEQWTQHGLKGQPNVQTLLTSYPIPLKLPTRLNVVFTPTEVKDTKRTPKQTQELLDAWNALFVAWGNQDKARVAIYEPQSAEKGTTKR